MMTHIDRQPVPTVRRLGETDRLDADLYAIENDGCTVATVDYSTARLFWLGRLKLSDLVNGGGVNHDRT